MQRGYCPIYNDTLKTFMCSSTMCVNVSKSACMIPVCALCSAHWNFRLIIQADFDTFTHRSLDSTNTQRFKAYGYKSGIASLYAGSLEMTRTVPLKLIYPALTQQGNTAACYRALNSEGFLPLPPLEVKMKIKVVFSSYLHSIPSLDRVYANRAEDRNDLTQRGAHCLQTVYVLYCRALNIQGEFQYREEKLQSL